MDPKQSRGYRNRNPGNIDFVPANRWQGQLGKEPGPHGRFAVFVSHEYGIRALASLLATYQDRHGLRTIRGIINRWAPASENVTSAYVVAVCEHMGVGPDDPIDVHEFAHLRPLVEAIITHELGGNPYPPEVIDEALRLSGVPRPVTTLADAAQTGTGRGAITVAGAASAAAVAAPAIQAVGGLPQWLGVAVVVAVAAVAVAYVLTQRRRVA